ncbi:hypothetical protein NC653_001277 [Populus alba x Populus x berolinensis]|uniref:Uncharacterized protein n=1 Tax=Populus alba x Populus x berolinensis TaxID=444605 RepID=A0AAD6WFA5_9ROSI|nr:hypothetical protein NC653_001277 [Populus alba x Populus x berolinensis]
MGSMSLEVYRGWEVRCNFEGSISYRVTGEAVGNAIKRMLVAGDLPFHSADGALLPSLLKLSASDKIATL